MYQFNETFPENLSIEQVSRIFNIPKSTLRYWEDKGLLHPIRNKENGYREYSRYAITEIEDLLTYKTMGLSILDMQSIKKAGALREKSCYQQAKEALLKQLEEIHKNIHFIQHRDKQLEKYFQLKQSQKYKFSIPDITAIIKWQWNDNGKNLHDYLMNSYMGIVFFPDKDMHFADGIFIDDNHNPNHEYLWRNTDSTTPWIEFLLETDYGAPASNNLKEHLDELHGRGYKTGMVLSKFPTSDISPSDQRPHDYLDAWVEILPL